MIAHEPTIKDQVYTRASAQREGERHALTLVGLLLGVVGLLVVFA